MTEQTPNTRAPLHTYLNAKGYMQRKAFTTVILSLFFLSILLQVYVVQQLKAQGVNIAELKHIPLPVWAHIIMLIASVLVIPAIIMRTRDASWPITPFVALYVVHLFLGVLYNFIGVPIPGALGMVVQGSVYIALIALMFKRTTWGKYYAVPHKIY